MDGQRAGHDAADAANGAVMSDRMLTALIILAGSTFIVTILWLLVGPR